MDTKDININFLMDNLRSEIYRKIKEENLSQTQFSVICGVSYENLYRILSKKSNDISASTLLKICNNSGIKIEDVFGIDNFNEKKIEIIAKYDGKIIKNFRFGG